MQRLAIALLIALVAGAVHQSIVLTRMDARNVPLDEPVELEIIAMADFLSTSWTSARGEENVTTYARPNETDADHLARHNARVTLAQNANPPV